MKTNKIQEAPKSVSMDAQTYSKVYGKIPSDTSVTITGDKPSPTSGSVMEEDDMIEPEAVITPQDDATIKYLSNVRDSKTGKVSQPFTIGTQKYQMVRGITPSKEIIMAVFCHDETDDGGNNVIHPIELFEKTIVQPMMEKEKMMQQEVMIGNDFELEAEVKPQPKKGNESLNLSEFKHYLVNEKSGKFRKFKNIVELAAAVMAEDEKYMPIKEFRKFFENRVFGGKKESEITLTEVALTGQETDEEMNQKAKKLMDMIKKRIPTMIIDTIKTPIAKREVIAAFAEMIGVPRQGLPNLINGLKALAKAKPTAVGAPVTPGAPAAAATTPPAENQLAPITENLSKPKVIKTIKVKDIK